MAEFWIFSNLLRQKCEQNTETQKLCQTIGAKYMEGEQSELRAQNAREENITLKLDVGNLESLCHTFVQNNEAQAELDTLLKEYYEEHLRVAFDIDECEIEKLHNYEEIKIELESRESANVFQRFYWRKIKMATKMEDRMIVRNYRDKEREFLKTENERLNLEESLKKLKEKIKEDKASLQELYECILRLVKGSKDLENMYSRQNPHEDGFQNGSLKHADKGHLFGTIDRTRASNQLLHKGGLSSRLLLDFNQFKHPSVPALPKIPTINPTKGLSRLLQQAEVLRKSMQRSVPVLSDDPPIPKFSSILKVPTEFAAKPLESFQKAVSFEADLPQEIPISNNIADTLPSADLPQEILVSNNIPDTLPSADHITLDTTISEITVDCEPKKNQLENSKVEPKKVQIEILENIIVKPKGTPLPVQIPPPNEEHFEHNPKRKITSEDHNYVANTPPKRNRNDTDTLDLPIEIGSKSFMDMFLDFSKDTSTELSSLGEPKKKSIQDVEMKEPGKKFKEEVMKNVIKEDKKQTKQSKDSFDDFDDFFSGFAGNGSDNNDNEHTGGDMSFNFLEGNENPDDDVGSDNFSFKF